MTRHEEKLETFSRMHRGDRTFLMPNAWDAGTARILDRLGYQALATTSAGLAFSLGTRDSRACLTRDQVLDNARSIVEATDLPVSADLEDGFGISPEACAETIRNAEEIGLCGGSIEDATGDPEDPIYDFDLAVERIHAAAEAKGSHNFVLTARAENFIQGRPSLDDTIRRLQAFEMAGADVLFAPGLPDIESIERLCGAVSAPVSVVVGLSNATYSVQDLSNVGVRRISVGGSFARAALRAFLRAAKELKDSGTYDYARSALSDEEASGFMAARSRD